MIHDRGNHEYIYEDKVNGKMSEELCLGLLEKYHSEKKKLQTELEEITERLETENQGRT